MLALGEDMGLPRVPNHLGLPSQKAQAVVELIPLKCRDSGIGIAVQDQGGRVALIDVAHWRVFIVKPPAFEEIAEILGEKARRYIASGTHAEKISYRSAHYRRPEAIGVRDGPRG